MRYGTFLPALAACFALVFLAVSSNNSIGQGGGITDESSPSVEISVEEPTTVEIKPQTPAPKPAPAAPAAAIDPRLPNNAQDINALVLEIGRLETVADQVLANQQKIDAALDQLDKTVEQARIYASRSGRGPAPAP